MNSASFFVLALTAGSAMAFQVVVNTQLRRFVGMPMIATLFSMAIGSAAALLYCVVARYPVPSVAEMRQSPWWAWLGGFVGVFYLWCSVVVSPRLGVSLTLALVVAGQIVTSVIIDHFGLLGAALRPLSTGRLTGVCLLVLGVAMITYYRE